jgi:hypothetical protein
VNEFIIPNYKQTWAGMRKIADAPEVCETFNLQVKRIRRLIYRAPTSNLPGRQHPGQAFWQMAWTRSVRDHGAKNSAESLSTAFRARRSILAASCQWLSFEFLEDRTFRPIVALAASRKVGNGVPDRRKLRDLAVEIGDMRER